jgi:hypothetical protein
LVSTGHGDLTLAKARAKEILEEIFDGKVKKVKPKGQRVSTVAEIIEAFQAGDRHVRPQTLKEYENCLVRILTETKGIKKEAAKKLRISELTGELVRQFQSLRQGKGRGVDYVTAAKVHTGINSAVRHEVFVAFEVSRRQSKAHRGLGAEGTPATRPTCNASSAASSAVRIQPHPIFGMSPKCDGTGDYLYHTFAGSALTAFVLAGPDSGALEVSVDGSDWRRVELYHSFSKGLNYPRTVILADDLAGSYHTAAIRTAAEKPAGSEGNAATILFFGVNE